MATPTCANQNLFCCASCQSGARTDLNSSCFTGVCCATCAQASTPPASDCSTCCVNGFCVPDTPLSAGSCHIYDSSIAVPESFAASYNTLSVQNELLLRTDCDPEANMVDFSVGNGSELQFIWDKAYFFRDGAWQEFDLDPGNSRTAPNWIIGQGSKSIRLRTEEMAQYNHLAAYVCTYQNERWNCGCQDQACLTPYWNLQSFQMSTTPPSPPPPVQTCTSEGFECCDACQSGTAQTTYDGDCGSQVCCSACATATPDPEPEGCPATCPQNQVCDPVTDQCVAVVGNVFYVDLDASTNGNGSYNSPWNSVSAVNAHNFTDGDDVFFKVGTSETVTNRLDINWSGTPANRVVIGAYYGDGLFGLNGGARPILDGNDTVPPSINSGLIFAMRQPGYITIENLEIRRSGGNGVEISYGPDIATEASEYNIVRNCYFLECQKHSILLARNSHSLVEDNYTYFDNKIPPGSSIEITGMRSDASAPYLSNNNTVRGNTVNFGNEGIGIYKGSRYTIVENNTVYDTRAAIYGTNSRSGTIRNNLVYITPESRQNPSSSYCISLDNEGHNPAITAWDVGDWDIYDNYIAGCGRGIGIMNDGIVHGDEYAQNDNNVYNNRIVDNEQNFYFATNDPAWSNNQFYDNYSFILTSNFVHSNNYSPYGVSWNNNFWNTPVSGNAVTNQNTANVELIKTTGWRDLQPGQVTRSDFDFVGGTSSTGSCTLGSPLPCEL
jgi:parallel beta-helix repeat protein